MRTDVNQAFAKFERRTERIIAVLRLLALFVLALVFWVLGLLDSRQATMVPWAGFVLTTLAGLVTPRRSLFLPSIPWLLTNLHVGFLIPCLVMLALAPGPPLPLALDTPPAALSF